MDRAYEFRIYPDRLQRQLIAKTFGCCRLVYNHYLAERKHRYEETKIALSYTDCAKDLTRLKKEKPFLREVDSIALQQSLRHLDSAFTNFFRQAKAGYPRFKSRKSGRNSYSTVCVNGNIRLGEKTIRLPKLGDVKIRRHRDIPEGWMLKSVTVKQTASGKYFVCVLFHCESQAEEKEIRTTAGLDFSMPDLFVASDGYRCSYPKFYRRAEERLAREQRKLSKMRKGSNNYRKQKIRIAKLHEKTANQRKDFLHKQSLQLAQKYDLVSIEDLDMQGMSRALRFGKSVHDDGWGMFTRMLEYKLEDRGGRLVKVSRWFPSSQVCSGCGTIHPEVKGLDVREWFCENCLQHHDRDVNAAVNIREEGRYLLKKKLRGSA